MEVNASTTYHHFDGPCVGFYVWQIKICRFETFYYPHPLSNESLRLTQLLESLKISSTCSLVVTI